MQSYAYVGGSNKYLVPLLTPKEMQKSIIYIWKKDVDIILRYFVCLGSLLNNPTCWVSHHNIIIVIKLRVINRLLFPC